MSVFSNLPLVINICFSSINFLYIEFFFPFLFHIHQRAPFRFSMKSPPPSAREAYKNGYLKGNKVACQCGAQAIVVGISTILLHSGLQCAIWHNFAKFCSCAKYMFLGSSWGQSDDSHQVGLGRLATHIWGWKLFKLGFNVHCASCDWGPLHTWAKSCDHEIMRAQKRVSKGRPKDTSKIM